MRILIIFSVCLLVNVNGDNSTGERIAGGTVVSIDSYPFAAALLSNGGEGTFVQTCGGTILTNSAILSAASCFYSNGVLNPVAWWRARVGSSFGNAAGTIHVISRITPHPDFSSVTRNNDIAVLRTTIPIQYQAGVVAPARIAGGAYTFATNQAVWAIGWGATSGTDPTHSEQLRQAQMWVINQETCVNRYNQIGFGVSSNMVCVGWLDVGVRGQCQGDGGSPIVDDGAVVGVFSWAEGCADMNFPNINTRVSPYTEWIVATAIAA